MQVWIFRISGKSEKRVSTSHPPQHWGIVLSKSKTSPTFNTRTVRGGKNKTDIVWKLTDWLTLSRSFDNPVFGTKAGKNRDTRHRKKMNHPTFRNVPCSGFRETSSPPVRLVQGWAFSWAPGSRSPPPRTPSPSRPTVENVLESKKAYNME